MPITGTQNVLGALIEAKLQAALGPTYIPDPNTLKTWTAIADAIITHLVAQGLVTIPPGGVIVATAGSPSAQTGASTAPAVGTIS